MGRWQGVKFYGIAFFVLLAIEVLIALYVHDGFVRPYVGDMLVVLVVYCFVRMIIPKKCRLLPFWVFVFAVCVELLQYIGIVEILGVENNAFLRTLIGTSFAWGDIWCYAVGCVVLELWERFVMKKRE